MQTFLPYPDYVQTAQCLDQKRLGKQRVECKQILLALGVPVGNHAAGTSHWKRHPAVIMWKGHEMALCAYAHAICQEWIRRGFKDILDAQFSETFSLLYNTKARDGDTTFLSDEKPEWMGNELFHASHRSNLLRKDREYYSKFGWTEPDNLPYLWPVSVEALSDD